MLRRFSPRKIYPRNTKEDIQRLPLDDSQILLRFIAPNLKIFSQDSKGKKFVSFKREQISVLVQEKYVYTLQAFFLS